MTVDEEERKLLQALRDEDPDKFERDQTMYDLLENLTTNDSFMWLPEGFTGDLTSAPILAVLGDEERAPAEAIKDDDLFGSGLYPCGRDEGGIRCQPILWRWAFMNYAVTSPQRDLLESGKAVWHGGDYVERPGVTLAYLEREQSLRF